MALDQLATPADLSDRNITMPDGMDPDVILNAASAAVRDAAGCPISSTESTVTLVADDYVWLDLPGGPVTAVATVTVDDVEVTTYTRFGDSLKMPTGWTRCLPVNVDVTYTHGYAAVPADIVDLVCGLASMAFAAEGSYGTTGRDESVTLGDYSEKLAAPAEIAESPSPIVIPETVRARLRARFGSNVAVVGVRR